MTEENKISKDRIFFRYVSIAPESFMLTLKTLSTNYPNCFSFKEQKILKVGILYDLMDDSAKHNITKSMIKKFLFHYTNTPEYMEKHFVGASRYDLEGNVVGTVTPEDQVVKKKSNHLYRYCKKKKEQPQITEKNQ